MSDIFPPHPQVQPNPIVRRQAASHTVDIHHPRTGGLVLVNAAIYGVELHLRVDVYDVQRRVDSDNCVIFQNINQNGIVKASLCRLWDGHSRDHYCRVVVLYRVELQWRVDICTFLLITIG